MSDRAVIPPQIAAAGLLVTALGGFAAGWTVNGWRWQSRANAALSESNRQIDALTARNNSLAADYERSQVHESDRQVVREGEIRTYYRDRLVPSDCAIVGAARWLLEDARTTANSRIGGEPSSPVPSDSATAGAND